MEGAVPYEQPRSVEQYPRRRLKEDSFSPVSVLLRLLGCVALNQPADRYSAANRRIDCPTSDLCHQRPFSGLSRHHRATVARNLPFFLGWDNLNPI
jgi:hypothetical protein